LEVGCYSDLGVKIQREDLSSFLLDNYCREIFHKISYGDYTIGVKFCGSLENSEEWGTWNSKERDMMTIL